MKVLQKNVIIGISELDLDPENPNEMNDIQMRGLKESLNKFGLLEPVIINQNHMVIDGEHRYLAWRALGNKKIMVTKLQFRDRSEERLLRQAMNKLHGKHDKQKDFNELDFLINNQFLDINAVAELTGQTSDALQTFLDSMADKDTDVIDVVEHQRGLPKEKTFDFVCPKCNFEFNLDDMQK